ncbi:MAG TPA: amidohydrolase family protein, partial [Thermoplasmata archaeon]|nr:amidohydrolase family protein [Thermoplasmata archaeon]
MAGETTAWSGGRIFTGTRYVEALLTESGHVSAVGTDREIRRATPAGAEHRDLRGRLALPGLIDAHLHWADSVVAAVGADLRGARSLSELRGRLGDAAGRSSEGPVVGSGWDQERMAERRYPTRHDLDAEVPSRPVVLFRICQHVAVANSSALELMGIDGRTPDPPGGRIERESDGSANGVLVDAALRFLQPFVEEVFRSNHRLARGVLASASARGLTSLGLMRARAGELALGAEEGRAGRSRLALRFYVPPELMSSGSRR